MTDEQKTTVIGYAEILSDQIPTGSDDDALLNLVVDTVSDRVLLYLNETEIADGLLRVIAQIVVNSYNQALAESNTTSTAQAISSISDNGQTVSYSNNAKQYMATASDQELFSGFTTLLNSYRRPHVITD